MNQVIDLDYKKVKIPVTFLADDLSDSYLVHLKPHGPTIKDFYERFDLLLKK